MIPRDLRCSRRRFLASAAALTIAGKTMSATDSPAGRRPLALLASVYRPLSYAYHLAGRFIHGYPRDGQQHLPCERIASIWVEQFPENDLSRELAAVHGIRRARTVRTALLENDKLAVEGVLIIAEHGNYPRNELGQILYPRGALFEQVVEVIRSVGRPIPVFIAKHLSYSFAQAMAMVESARNFGIPLMAGSATTRSSDMRSIFSASRSGAPIAPMAHSR